jgi:hypothetical protein
VRARRLLHLGVKVGWRVVGRPFRGRWRCLVLRLWVARAVVGVVFVVATEVESVVVLIAAPTAAVIALGLARAAALEQALRSEQLLAERAGLVCCCVEVVPGVLLLAGLRSVVCRWWSARVRHLGRPCCLRYFTCILCWYNGT